jgi:SCP1.201-like deaminase
VVLYDLMFHPENRDVFLAMMAGDPSGFIELGAADMVAMYRDARALWSSRVSLGNLALEANDVLSAVGSNVHPNVPPWKGGSARGVLTYDGVEIPLKSSKGNPGQWLRDNLDAGEGSGLNAIIPTHVEGHAAAIMNKYDITEGAELFLNKPPCPEGGMCRYNLNKLLPDGAVLPVHFLGDDGVTVHTWIFRAGVARWVEVD